MQAHQAFHFLHGCGRRVRFQKGVVALAVLVDLVGHRLDAPVLVFNDFAAVVRKDGREVFDKAFGLRVGKILTRYEYMLVKRHVVSSLVGCISQDGHFHFRSPSTRGCTGYVGKRKNAALYTRAPRMQAFALG